MKSAYDSLDAVGMAELVAKGETTPGELLDIALDRVSLINLHINAVVRMREDVARRRIAEGLPAGQLRGVPFLLKDLGCEAIDFPSNNGSRLLAVEHYPRDSAIFERIRDAGVVTFGRATSPEAGIGTATEAIVYGGPTRNPWNLSRTPGGSSGGSAAAVAAGIVPAAHGSDGGGSVRIPAASCGLFGFKATRARFPDGPYVGEGWAGMAIDGFLTRSVRDTAVLADACAGADLGAPYWAPPLKRSYQDAITRPPSRLRVALCDTTLMGKAITPEVRDAVQDAARLLESLGHTIEVARPKADTYAMMEAWTTIVACGTTMTVKRALKGRALGPQDVESVVRGAVKYAASITGADYVEALTRIHTYGREMAAFFQEFDILLTATLAELPAEIGRFAHTTEDYVGYRTGPGMVFEYAPFTAAFNASGQPAASLPLAWSKDGLPIGIHLAARFGEDEKLMALCAELEAARPWFHRRPPLAMTASPSKTH
jgi:amidase/6-aminohexanoate-cyclic-dimer hydrolase